MTERDPDAFEDVGTDPVPVLPDDPEPEEPEDDPATDHEAPEA